MMGPAVVITIGVLFLLQEVRGGYFGFDNTYPIILVVIGTILLASSLASNEGHVSNAPPSVPPVPPVPGSTPGLPPPGQGQ
jgi:hypothetical protein